MKYIDLYIEDRQFHIGAQTGTQHIRDTYGKEFAVHFANFSYNFSNELFEELKRT